MSNRSKLNGKGKGVPQHRYLDKLALLHKYGAFKPGEVSMINVAHDDWCPKLRGGVCSYNPNIRIQAQVAAHNSN